MKASGEGARTQGVSSGMTSVWGGKTRPGPQGGMWASRVVEDMAGGAKMWVVQ